MHMAKANVFNIKKLCTTHYKKLNLAWIKITRDVNVNFNPANSSEYAPFGNLIKQILDETEVVLQNS